MRCKRPCSRTNQDFSSRFHVQTMANEVQLMAIEVRQPGCRPRGLWVCGPASLNYYQPAHRPGPNPSVNRPGKPGTPPPPGQNHAPQSPWNWHFGAFGKIRNSGKVANHSLSRNANPSGHRDPPGQTSIAGLAALVAQLLQQPSCALRGGYFFSQASPCPVFQCRKAPRTASWERNAIAA